ncbi:MAG: dATP/dGTP diphosphohydrolase domain-containing protein [Treponema sp.]|nr:dATP/dGTP diphosphohydrolase domain-containing protein [Treponema sp.]
MNSFIVKDSGNRERFVTGAVRDTANDKPRPDLISPFFMMRLGEHLRKGANKYTEWNWAKGIPSSRCFASCMRHLMQYAMGKRDEDHLSAAAFNIMAIIHNEETEGKAELVESGSISSARILNDMPKFKEMKHENH